MTRYHAYAERVAGSDFVPLPLVLRNLADGLNLDLTGSTITVTIVDEKTNETIVKDGLATPNASNPYLVEYHPTPEQLARITAPSTWLAQWTIIAGNGRVHIEPTLCRTPVRPPLL